MFTVTPNMQDMGTIQNCYQQLYKYIYYCFENDCLLNLLLLINHINKQKLTIQQMYIQQCFQSKRPLWLEIYFPRQRKYQNRDPCIRCSCSQLALKREFIGSPLPGVVNRDMQRGLRWCFQPWGLGMGFVQVGHDYAHPRATICRCCLLLRAYDIQPLPIQKGLGYIYKF